jgi:hypothetical protein
VWLLFVLQICNPIAKRLSSSISKSPLFIQFNFFGEVLMKSKFGHSQAPPTSGHQEYSTTQLAAGAWA